MKSPYQSTEQIRQSLVEQIAAITTMQPGTLAEEYREHPDADGKGVVRRGPYFKYQCWHDGRNLSRRVPVTQAAHLFAAPAASRPVLPASWFSTPTSSLYGMILLKCHNAVGVTGCAQKLGFNLVDCVNVSTLINILNKRVEVGVCDRSVPVRDVGILV